MTVIYWAESYIDNTVFEVMLQHLPGKTTVDANLIRYGT